MLTVGRPGCSFSSQPYDRPGVTLLVLVVGDAGNPECESEAILRELKFAVAPAADLTETLKIVESLRPGLIVGRPEDASRLRAAAAVRVVECTASGTHDRELAGRGLEEIREAR